MRFSTICWQTGMGLSGLEFLGHPLRFFLAALAFVRNRHIKNTVYARWLVQSCATLVYKHQNTFL